MFVRFLCKSGSRISHACGSLYNITGIVLILFRRMKFYIYKQYFIIQQFAFKLCIHKDLFSLKGIISREFGHVNRFLCNLIDIMLLPFTEHVPLLFKYVFVQNFLIVTYYVLRNCSNVEQK
jgi:hypothetical protein